ncbi:hypothetical protein LCGC14_1054660 [marine sediment metagenome]|uniref:3-deoxy-8-phosphooctulonate synthase n=1 Tax=marine sediment metagenome TaxID=412755 RepID=A0A0F9MSD3_9ZZZZ
MMNNKLIYIAGPCVIDDPEITYGIAHALKDILKPFKDRIRFAFKASYDKANRTRHMSYRGTGLNQGLEVLASIKKDFGFKVTTDVHEAAHVGIVADVCDILQVPAFLCRQTDLVVECAKTGKTVNIKKGQFVAPQDMKYIVEKIEDHGNKNIIITERGSCFGYNNLIVDFRSIKIMQELGYPVIVDATHTTGGNRDFAPLLARAAIAAGANGVFTEVYPNPAKAQCDGPLSLYLSQVEELLEKLLEIQNICKS